MANKMTTTWETLPFWIPTPRILEAVVPNIYTVYLNMKMVWRWWSPKKYEHENGPKAGWHTEPPNAQAFDPTPPESIS